LNLLFIFDFNSGDFGLLIFLSVTTLLSDDFDAMRVDLLNGGDEDLFGVTFCSELVEFDNLFLPCNILVDSLLTEMSLVLLLVNIVFDFISGGLIFSL
jgi:hypothetical protein